MRRFNDFPSTLDETLLAGGYPAIPDRKIPPADWLSSYVSSYIERDVRTITNVGDLTTFQRFVELCAGRTGQLLNLSSLASDTGISQPTAKTWLSILETSFLVFRLRPYHANLRKRLVKMPKLHFYDTGLLCWLLGIRNVDQLRTHPLRGAIFETWVVSEIVKHRMNQGEHTGVYYLRDRHGTEIDVVVDRGDCLLAIEAKSGQTVAEDMLRMTRKSSAFLQATGNAVQTLLVHGGDVRQQREDMTVLPWNELDHELWTISTSQQKK
jgi:predicted AAA+ superfamily ATPase